MTAYWDIPVYADHTEVRANRIDVRIVDKERKKVSLLEMSCPWIENPKQVRRKPGSMPLYDGNQEAVPGLQDHSNEHYNGCTWWIF